VDLVVQPHSVYIGHRHLARLTAVRVEWQSTS
jgi:hypothetical protein